MGSLISFYHAGVLLGPDTSPLQMGVFANEQWFKSYVKVEFLNTLTGLNIWPNDDTGIATGDTVLQSAINQALESNIIVLNKVFSNVEKNFINTISGDTTAISAMESRGYWYTGEIIEQVDAGVTKNVYSYIIIYATSEGVSKVVGRHNLV